VTRSASTVRERRLSSLIRR